MASAGNSLITAAYKTQVRAAGRADAVGLFAVCLLHFALVCQIAAGQSPTIDEFAHLPAGITYLQTGTFRLYPYNPPLPRVPPALAALTQSPRMVYDRSWAAERPNHLSFAEEYLLANTTDAETTTRYFRGFFGGRCMIAAWSALTIPVLFVWGTWWFGRASGWLAALLWAACPNILAHAGLITTDLAAASFSLIASYFFARWLESQVGPHVTAPTSESRFPPVARVRLILAGLWLGLALLTKFSVVLLLPIWFVWMAGSAWKHLRQLIAVDTADGQRLRFVGMLTYRFAIIALIGGFVLNAGYLFEGTGSSLGEFPFVSEMLTRPRLSSDGPAQKSEDPMFAHLYRTRVNRFRGTMLESIPAPVPLNYALGFDILKFEAEGKYGQYLRGVWQRPDLPQKPNGPNQSKPASGWWYYYFYGLIVKWPLSTWLLLALASVAFFRRRGSGRSLVPWLLLAGGPLTALSLLQDVNLGLRYALPAFPFLFLIAATAVAVDPRQAGKPDSLIRRSLHWLPWLAVCWNIVCVVRIHPHELAYFNELTGGPQHGRFHLIDSNLDWGQDLARLAAWVKDNPEWSDVQIAYWGPTSPELYGLTFERLPPRDLHNVRNDELWPGEVRADPRTWGPQPGKYAISVNFERGMGFRTPCPTDWQAKLSPRSRARFGYTMLSVPWDSWSYFQQFTPRIEHRIGYSILLYDVSKADANRARKALRLPELP